MGLSSDLLSQFAKVTSDNKKTKTETIVYGTVKESDGKKYVQIDGSDLLTPTSTTADMKNGERVMVQIKDHSATIIGNMTTPSASSSEVAGIKYDISNALTADKADIRYAKIDSLDVIEADVDILKTNKLDVSTASATYAKITELDAAKATITKLQTDKLDAATAKITYATITNLDAANAEINTLKTDKLDASTAVITYAKITDLDAANAEINILKTNKLDAATAKITYATIDSLDSTKANIEELIADKLDAESANLKYANIDFSNIGMAAVEELFSKSGIINNLVVGDTKITGELVGVTIKGDLIEGNTIAAEKLVVKGEDGLYYKLNTDGMTVEAEQTEYNSLNGSIITTKSITATKIAVDDLVAFDATIGGFKITENSIYSGAKESVDNTTEGVFFGDDGQIAIGDASNFLKYYKDQNGNYKLEISADSILFGAGNTNVETAINNAKSEAISTAANDATTKANNALTSANTNTTNLLKDYSTTSEMNAAINLKADGIATSVSETYATKTELSDTNNEIDSVSTRVTSAESSITELSNKVTINVTEINNLGTRMTTVEQTSSDFTVRLDGLETDIGNIESNGSIVTGTVIGFNGDEIPEGYEPIEVDNVTNYMNFSSAGLVIGDMRADTLSNNVLIDNNSVDIRSGSTILSSFGTDNIYLGKNSESCVINLCSGAATMKVVNDTDFRIYTDKRLLLNGKTGVIIGEDNSYVSSLTLGQTTTKNRTINCYWSDGSLHDLLASVTDGATSYFGPADISNLSSTTILRGKTVRIYAHEGGAVYLGSSGTTAVTSDRNLKKDIVDIDDKYMTFFDLLRAVTFKYSNGHRDHGGMIAQEVEEALNASGLTTEQFAGIIIEEDVTLNSDYDSSLSDEENKANEKHYDKLYSLRYEEFIPLLIKKVQNLQNQINELKGE